MRRAVTRSRMGELRRGGRNDSERIGCVGGRRWRWKKAKGEKRKMTRGGRVIRPGHQGVSGASAEEQPRGLRAGAVERWRGALASSDTGAGAVEEGPRAWGPQVRERRASQLGFF